jgi:manganese/zinc/iron transport system substrate-binding protein
MKNTVSLLVLASTSLFLLPGCGPKPEPSVVCTTSIIADAAKRIAGPHLKIDCLLGPGVDPHKHQPSAGDIGKLASAKLVLFNGLHLEGKMVDLLEKPQSGRKAIAVTRTLDEKKELRQAEVDGGAHDPHVWFDVKLWMKCVAVIRDELCELDPAHATEFRQNAAEYLKELELLDAEVREKVNKLPANRRILITSHDAFGYFGAAYGFDVRGLQGVSTASESSISQVQEMVNLIAEKQIPAVFTETSVPPAGLLKVIEGVKSKSQLDLKVVGDDEALYSDALGEPGSTGATYPGMVRHNINVITKYLESKTGK